MKTRVAVLYGGLSSEREVSLESGQAVINALRSLDVEVLPLDSGVDLLERIAELKQSSIQQVFIALHGGAGENGTVQAMLEYAGIAYTGSGVLASALAMNKLRTKQLWQACGLKTPAYCVLQRNSTWQDVSAALGHKVIVKPASEGSSIGMCIANDDASFADAINEAFRYDEQVIAEQWIQGGEYTVAILGQEPLPVIQLKTDHQFYDYDAKYKADDTQYLCPCGLSEAEERAMQVQALEAFNALGCKGWGRVDVMRNAEGENYLLEANTVPGLTSHSLVPMAAKAAGIEFPELMQRILGQ